MNYMYVMENFYAVFYIFLVFLVITILIITITIIVVTVVTIITIIIAYNNIITQLNLELNTIVITNQIITILKNDTGSYF